MTPAEVELTERFRDLPHDVRLQVMDEFPIKFNREGMDDQKAYTWLFTFAERQGILNELWDAVEAAHADGRKAENPFA